MKRGEADGPGIVVERVQVRTRRGRALDARVVRDGDGLLTIAFDEGVDPKLSIGEEIQYRGPGASSGTRPANGTVASTYESAGVHHAVVSHVLECAAPKPTARRRPEPASSPSRSTLRGPAERPRAKVIAGGHAFRADIRRLSTTGLTIYVPGSAKPLLSLGAAIKLTLELPHTIGDLHFWTHVVDLDVLGQGTLYTVRFDLGVPGSSHQQEMLKTYLDHDLRARARAAGEWWSVGGSNP